MISTERLTADLINVCGFLNGAKHVSLIGLQSYSVYQLFYGYFTSKNRKTSLWK